MMPKIPQRIADTIEAFVGRTWLLEPLLHWLNKTDEHLFVLRGHPGTGKSMLTAWLAGAGPLPEDLTDRQSLERFRAQVAAVHFCEARSGNTSPPALARNMAEQLEENVKGFAEIIVELDREISVTSSVEAGKVESGGSVIATYIKNLNLGTLSDQKGFNRLLREPLQRLYDRGYNKRLILLIDALDEAETYTGDTKIAYLLSTLEDFPSEVRVLATTRPDPSVLQYIDVTPLDLVKDSPEEADDIGLYALARLQALKDTDRKKLAAQISQKADGVFLYAHLVLEDLPLDRPYLIDVEKLTLPDDLYDSYRHWLNRELGKDRRRWVELYKPFLGTLAVAQGDGLTREQLERIVAPDQDIELALSPSEQYLTSELPDGPFRLFHQSLVDFLLDKQKNRYYAIDAAQMHRRIATVYGRSYRNRWNLIDAYGRDYLPTHLLEADTENRLAPIRGDRYATRHLFHHMLAAERAADMEKVLDLVLES
jgi:hypothetical protein